MLIPKVPFIYYVSTFIAQKWIWLPNFSENLGAVFLSNWKNFFFNITFWRNFHDTVGNFEYIKKNKILKKFMKMLCLMAKSAYVIYEWSPRRRQWLHLLLRCHRLLAKPKTRLEGYVPQNSSRFQRPGKYIHKKTHFYSIRSDPKKWALSSLAFQSF